MARHLVIARRHRSVSNHETGELHDDAKQWQRQHEATKIRMLLSDKPNEQSTIECAIPGIDNGLQRRGCRAYSNSISLVVDILRSIEILSRSHAGDEKKKYEYKSSELTTL